VIEDYAFYEHPQKHGCFAIFNQCVEGLAQKWLKKNPQKNFGYPEIFFDGMDEFFY
jgi:hypothetical protein